MLSDIFFSFWPENISNIQTRIAQCANVLSVRYNLSKGELELIKLLHFTLLLCCLIPASYGASFNFGTLFSSNFKDAATGENVSSFIGSLSISQPLYGYGLSLSSFVSKSLSLNDSEYLIGNTTFAISSSAMIDDKYTVNSRIFTNLATSKYSRETKNLIGSIGHSLSIPYTFDFLDGKLSLSTSIINIYNFYEFETDIMGNSNIKNQHSVGVNLGYKMSSKISLSQSTRLTKSYNHSNIANDSYYLGASINYSFKKMLFSIGYEKADQLLMPNGQNSNLSLFDMDASSFYFSSGISF